MPPQIDIKAEVIDARSDPLQPTDRMLVDTNVWYWLTYTRASQSSEPPVPYQTTEYPTVVKRARHRKATLLRSGLSLGELAHLIEVVEHDLHSKTNKVNLTKKEFRHDPAAREAVKGEILAAWRLVEKMSELLALSVGPNSTERALKLIHDHHLDGYDAFMVTSANAGKVTQVLTDDGDYCCVPDISVFTCNAAVIKAAETQRRLVKRPTPSAG